MVFEAFNVLRSESVDEVLVGQFCRDVVVNLTMRFLEVKVRGAGGLHGVVEEVKGAFPDLALLRGLLRAALGEVRVRVKGKNSGLLTVCAQILNLALALTLVLALALALVLVLGVALLAL